MPALPHVPLLRRSIRMRTQDRCSPVETAQHPFGGVPREHCVQKTANLTQEA
jgi:hypothetical protein